MFDAETVRFPRDAAIELTSGGAMVWLLGKPSTGAYNLNRKRKERWSESLADDNQQLKSWESEVFTQLQICKAVNKQCVAWGIVLLGHSRGQ